MSEKKRVMLGLPAGQEAHVATTLKIFDIAGDPRCWSGTAWSSHLSLDSTGTTADDTLRCSKALVLEDGGVLQIMSGEVP